MPIDHRLLYDLQRQLAPPALPSQPDVMETVHDQDDRL
jgi:hypothetical protein